MVKPSAVALAAPARNRSPSRPHSESLLVRSAM